jgi:hypothetical protein
MIVLQRYSYRSPPQPSIHLEPLKPKRAVSLGTITYRRADSLPLLIDLPRPRKKRKVYEEIIHTYDDPVLYTDMKKYFHYPDIIARNGAEGKIQVTITIGKDGKIQKIQGRETDNPLLIEQAISDLKRYSVFKPLVIDGKPEKSFCDMEINFELGKE